MKRERKLLSTIREINTHIQQKRTENNSNNNSEYEDLIKKIRKDKKEIVSNRSRFFIRKTIPLYFYYQYSKLLLFCLIFACILSVFSVLKNAKFKFVSSNVKLLIPEEREIEKLKELLCKELKENTKMENVGFKNFDFSKINFDTILKEKSSNLYYVNAVTEEGTPFSVIAEKESSSQLKIINLSFE